MNYLEYLNKNIEGFGLIDKLRKNIKEIICKTIKEEFKGATESDVEKLSLMVECNFIDSITSSYTEWNIKEMTLEEVEIQIGGIVGFHHLCGGLDKNRRESYSELLYDVTSNAISCIEDIDKACECSNEIKEFYLMSQGEYDGEYYVPSDELMLDILSNVYKFLLKDKLD